MSFNSSNSDSLYDGNMTIDKDDSIFKEDQKMFDFSNKKGNSFVRGENPGGLEMIKERSNEGKSSFSGSIFTQSSKKLQVILLLIMIVLMKKKMTLLMHFSQKKNQKYQFLYQKLKLTISRAKAKKIPD